MLQSRGLQTEKAQRCESRLRPRMCTIRLSLCTTTFPPCLRKHKKNMKKYKQNLKKSEQKMEILNVPLMVSKRLFRQSRNALIICSALFAMSCQSTRTIAVQNPQIKDSVSAVAMSASTLITEVEPPQVDTAALEVTIPQLEALPTGASYTQTNKTTRVTLKKTGKGIVATAEAVAPSKVKTTASISSNASSTSKNDVKAAVTKTTEIKPIKVHFFSVFDVIILAVVALIAVAIWIIKKKKINLKKWYYGL